jgi:hypothetical protein
MCSVSCYVRGDGALPGVCGVEGDREGQLVLFTNT